MSGGDEAVQALSMCPLFAARSRVIFQALQMYTNNIKADFEDTYFRDEDVAFHNPRLLFFKMKEDFSGVLMHCSTNPLLHDYVFVAVKLFVSLVCLANVEPATVHVDMIKTFFENIVGVHWEEERIRSEKFESLKFNKAEVISFVRLMREKEHPDACKLAAVFGWLMALVGSRTRYLQVLIEILYSVL